MQSTLQKPARETPCKMDDACIKAAAAVEDLKEAASEITEVAKEKLDQLRQRAATSCGVGCEKIQRIERGVEDCIRQNPLWSVLCAAGIGVLVGVLARWRR